MLAAAAAATAERRSQLSLGEQTVMVVSDLQGHPKSMIFISFESQ